MIRTLGYIAAKLGFRVNFNMSFKKFEAFNFETLLKWTHENVVINVMLDLRNVYRLVIMIFYALKDVMMTLKTA